MTFQSYAAVRRYLARFTDYERQTRVAYGRTTYNLDRVRALCRALGDPQDRLHAIHITGTKGKGSTAAMVASCLRAHGFSVGLYTSPHLVEMEERIAIDGRPIPRPELVRLMNRVVPHLEAMRQAGAAAGAAAPGRTVGAGGGTATYFEIMTAVAFLYFVAEKVDFAVIEVGLGGRLDATNVLRRPLATAVTCVDFDHMDKLGHTLAAIAREKAGIAKPGCPMVTGERNPEPLARIEQACARRGAPLYRAGRELDLLRWRPVWVRGRPGVEVDVRGRRRDWRRLVIPLAGSHQARNAVVAIGLLETLADAGAVRLRPAAVRAGLAATRIRARIEVVRPSPWPGGPGLIVDGAHNPVSLQGLLGVLELYPGFADRRRVVVLGVSRDKEPHRLVFVARGARAVVCTAAPSPRACDPEDLRDYLAATGWDWPRGLHVARTPAQALARARALAGGRDWVVVTGSFYLAGAVLAQLAARPRRRRRPNARRPRSVQSRSAARRC